MGTRRAGLSDVAREADVSTTTASDALRGRGRVAESTRERVRAAATRLGYQPNPLARSLLGGRTGLIAVAFSHTTDVTAALADKDYLRQAIVSMTGEALALELGLIVGPPTRHPDMWEKIPMDGLIVFSPVRGDPLLPQIRRKRLPMVLVGRDPNEPSLDPCVDNDHVAGTHSVLEHLRARGATRPALVALDLDDAFTDDCVAGYRQWCQHRSLIPEILMVPPGSPVQQASMIRDFVTSADAPDAVHVTVWETGIRVAEVAMGMGLMVPDDLMIAACGDTEPPPGELQITQLKLFPEIAARQAIQLLTNLIDGGPPADLSPVPTQLVVRTSTDRRRTQ
jgi:DNA-binding LacI/PurR family transcriptional regulator